MADVAFRPFAPANLPLLYRWLREPHVAEWWRNVPADLAAAEAEYGPHLEASWRILEKAGFSRIWSGELDSPDPSDEGPQHVYVLSR
ncbi:MAG TPA: acetyltransferase [Mycobacteriales bacterium]|jgi:RimJ/RimL family protein N-acetyltransferase|nr:acetyltransferase [Mycobacteriales bacterium]